MKQRREACPQGRWVASRPFYKSVKALSDKLSSVIFCVLAPRGVALIGLSSLPPHTVPNFLQREQLESLIHVLHADLIVFFIDPAPLISY